ncbi:MAG TPA: hypothetical protein GX708_24390 [Gallicola sp.]|nr:hypothetical protein [Gallicola sp.]
MINIRELTKDICKENKITDINAIIVEDVVIMLSKLVSEDYLKPILYKTINEIIEDVNLTSGIEDNGTYTNDDLKMSIGRIITYKIGIEL